MTSTNYCYNYPSVDITPYIPFEVKKSSDLENLGYFLIGDQLISYAFYDRLVQKLSGQMFFFESVDSLENICGQEYWETLTLPERKAAGICVLALIQKGQIAFTLREEEFSDNH